jgi:glycosyltransferase involved in cell wall biosynthesis
MDYAQGNREILGNESMFLMPWRKGGEEHPVTKRMREIAPLRFYRTEVEREDILKDEKADFFYCIKNGFNDGVFSRKVPTGVHAIFRESEFHGDIYGYVSPWLSEVMTYGRAPWVPHMVRMANEPGSLRAEYGIPNDATVFGRHGGDDSFDIPWVQKAVVEKAKKNPEIWFLFLNTRGFRGAAGLPNLKFLPATADPIRKSMFLNSCDAMLHGRMRGETVGLSCLEFAMLGKPVLTFAGSPERAHLDILGESAVPYANAYELEEILRDPASAVREQRKNTAGGDTRIDSRFERFRPEAVMKKFYEAFLN